MPRMLFILFAALSFPSLSFSGDWKHAVIPYHRDATEAYMMRIGNVTCYIGTLKNKHRSVIFEIHTWKKRNHMLFEEAVLDPGSGKLREYNLGEVNGKGFLQYREGVPDFRFPCQRHVKDIPSRYVRDTLLRYLEHVVREQERKNLFIDGISPFDP